MKARVLSCLVILCLGCHQSKNKNQSDKHNQQTGKVETKNDLHDTVQKPLYKKATKNTFPITKKFSNTFKKKYVQFNDGSKWDFQKPLSFNKVNHSSSTVFIGSNLPSDKNLDLDSTGVSKLGGGYHPSHIGKIALRAINNYKLTHSERAKNIFFDQVHWAEKDFHENELYGVWAFPFAMPSYKLKKGWPSAYTQGIMLNVFLEAYKLDPKPKYLEILKKGLKAFVVPIENGGLSRRRDKLELWYEEYTTKRPSLVLNGMIFSLESVYNVYKETESKFAKKVFYSGVNTIKNHLVDYNAQYRFRYNLADWKNEVSKENYQQIYPIQLLWLYHITNDPIFKKYAEIALEQVHEAYMPQSIYHLPQKFKSISADYCIDCEKYGTSNLTNAIWAYGNYWSSNKKASLIIDFGEEKTGFTGLTLYHVNERSTKVDFKLYALNPRTKKWENIQDFFANNLKDVIAGRNKTKQFETYIRHYKIFEPISARKLKLVFQANNKNIIAFRLIDFRYDRSDELKKIDDQLAQRMTYKFKKPLDDFIR